MNTIAIRWDCLSECLNRRNTGRFSTVIKNLGSERPELEMKSRQFTGDIHEQLPREPSTGPFDVSNRVARTLHRPS
jgi:hypothetical protein